MIELRRNKRKRYFFVVAVVIMISMTTFASAIQKHNADELVNQKINDDEYENDEYTYEFLLGPPDADLKDCIPIASLSHEQTMALKEEIDELLECNLNIGEKTNILLQLLDKYEILNYDALVNGGSNQKNNFQNPGANVNPIIPKAIPAGPFTLGPANLLASCSLLGGFEYMVLGKATDNYEVSNLIIFRFLTHNLNLSLNFIIDIFQELFDQDFVDNDVFSVNGSYFGLVSLLTLFSSSAPGFSIFLPFGDLFNGNIYYLEGGWVGFSAVTLHFIVHCAVKTQNSTYVGTIFDFQLAFFIASLQGWAYQTVRD